MLKNIILLSNILVIIVIYSNSWGSFSNSDNIEDNFSFKNALDEKSFKFRDINHEQYILAHTTNNAIDFRFYKKFLSENDIDMLSISNCRIPIYQGSVLSNEDSIYQYNCDDYTISTDDTFLSVKFKYEEPICGYPIKMTSYSGSHHQIIAHNVLLFDSKHKLVDYLWDKSSEVSENGSIIFKKPNHKPQLLSLKRKISRDFTVHLDFSEQKRAKEALPFIKINDIAIIFKVDGTVTFHDSKTNRKISTQQIPPIMLKNEPTITLSRRDSNLSVRVTSNKTTHELKEEINIFEQSKWSTFSVGSHNEGKPLKLDSITIVGKPDDY